MTPPGQVNDSAQKLQSSKLLADLSNFIK